MKKVRILALLMATALVATACGDKDSKKGGKSRDMGKVSSVTVDEIKDDLSDEQFTSYNLELSGSMGGSFEVADADATVEMLLDMVSQQYGIDLSKKVDVDFTVDMSSEGKKNDDAAHITADGKMDINCSNAELLELIKEEMGDEYSFPLNLEADMYRDYVEGISYEYSAVNGEGEWSTGYAGSGESDLDYTEIMELFSQINDATGDVTVYEKGDVYTVSWKINIDNDFILNMDEDQREIIEAILGATYSDVDIEEMFEMLDEVGDMVKLNIPISLSVEFESTDDGYRLTGLDADASIDVNVSVSAEDLGKLSGEATFDQLSFLVKANAKAKGSISATFGYDDEKVSIPDSVKEEAN